MNIPLKTNITHAGTFTVEGDTSISYTYTLTWRNGRLEIDPLLVDTLERNGYTIAPIANAGNGQVTPSK